MNNVLCIAAGGAAGALARYWAASGVQVLLGSAFPYGILVVNVSGCLAMGFLYVLLADRFGAGSGWSAGLLVGFLGAYTTFSAFSIDTLKLFESGQQLQAALNVVLSVALCLLACWAGLVLGRALAPA